MGILLMGLLAAGSCLEQFEITHAASPLSEMRRQGIPANDFPEAFRAVTVDAKSMRRLGSFGDLLWVAGT